MILTLSASLLFCECRGRLGYEMPFVSDKNKTCEVDRISFLRVPACLNVLFVLFETNDALFVLLLAAQ